MKHELQEAFDKIKASPVVYKSFKSDQQLWDFLEDWIIGERRSKEMVFDMIGALKDKS